jgi:cyclohexadieny/prephenate dehydrogenase
MANSLSAPLEKPAVKQLCVIGIGLIGGSILRGARRQNFASELIACDLSDSVCERVRELGIADRTTQSVSDAVSGADMVILCTPVGVMADVARELGKSISSHAVVSDVGSVKSSVIAAVGPHLRESKRFVPAHPVAGTEHSGPDAGFAELFVNRWCILTPPESTEAGAIELVASLWSALGSNVEVMSAAHHDLVLAITSHVPHLIAYNIVGTAAELEEVTRSEVIKFSAGGFRDFTRIAASDPTMWRDIFLHNKSAVLEMLARFDRDLSAAREMVEAGDGQGLFDLFTRTRAIRRGIIALGQETAAPDFGRLSTQAPPAKSQ